MGQDQSFIPVSLDLLFAYHKVKAYRQDPPPKKRRPIISQGNWLFIVNNNGTVWGPKEKARQREQERDGGLNKECLKLVTQQAYWLDRNWKRVTTNYLHFHWQVAYCPAFIPFLFLSFLFPFLNIIASLTVQFFSISLCLSLSSSFSFL